MRLVLDTGCVRNLIHSSEPLADFEQLRANETINVSIAEPAFAELICAVQQGRVGWEDWRTALATLAQTLDTELPVLPGRQQLCEMAINQVPPNAVAHIQNGWTHLVEAEQQSHLSRRRTYTAADGEDYEIIADLPAAQIIRQEVHQDWICIIHRLQRILRPMNPSDNEIESIVSQGFDVPEGLTADRLDAAVRFLTRFVRLALQNRPPYNPIANANDGFDFELLYSLCLEDAVLCTTDGRFCNIVRATGSHQATRLIDVSSLNAHLSSGTLAELL